MGRTKTLSPPFACRNPHCTTATPDLHYCEVTSSNHPCKFKSRASGLDAVTTRHAPHATQPSILCFSEYSKVNLGLKNLMLSMRLAVLCCLCPSCLGIRRKQSFTCWKKGSGNEDKFLDLVEKIREFQFGLVGLWFQTKVLAWPSCGLPSVKLTRLLNHSCQTLVLLDLDAQSICLYSMRTLFSLDLLSNPSELPHLDVRTSVIGPFQSRSPGCAAGTRHIMQDPSLLGLHLLHALDSRSFSSISFIQIWPSSM